MTQSNQKKEARKNGNFPASPVCPTYKDTHERANWLRSDEFPECVGLTKREYFAAMAMQGLIASSNGNYSDSTVATNSVHAADALLQALAGS